MIQTHNLEITPEILRLITRIDEFKGAWRVHEQTSPTRLKALRCAANAANIAAAFRLEGQELHEEEVTRLLAQPASQALQQPKGPMVTAHAALLDVVFNVWDKIPFSCAHMQQMHRILFHHDETAKQHKGLFKTQSNALASTGSNSIPIGVLFESATPAETPYLMEDLVTWVAEARQQQGLHGLLVIAVVVATLLRIQPFQAGNQRMAGILTYLLLLQGGYGFAPSLALDNVLEQRWEQGLYALWQTQGGIFTTSPEWQPWVEFFLSSLLVAMERLEQLLTATPAIETTPSVNEPLPTISQRIIDLARDRGRISIGDVIDSTGISRNTLKQHFRNLVAKGYLSQYGGGRGVWYMPCNGSVLSE